MLGLKLVLVSGWLVVMYSY